jgi:hypothetical protein
LADIQTSFEYTGNGTSGPWPISADYISQSYWVAQNNGVPVAITWVGPGLVSIPTAVGDALVIWRVTPNASAITQYQDDSSLVAADLNIENTQLLHLIQEARWTSFKENLRDTTAVNAAMAAETSSRLAADVALNLRADKALSLGSTEAFWEARGKRLQNLAYPVEDSDGATIAAVRAALQTFVNTTTVPPGYDPSYDYVSLQAAMATTPTVLRSHVRVGGFNDASDLGHAVWRRLGAAPAIVHPGTRQDASGNWWQIAEARPNVRQFGARGDNVTDDTAAIQGAIDACIRMRKELILPHGTYVVGPLSLNGSFWDGSVTGPQDSVRGFYGEGGIYFGSTLAAKAGAYAQATGYTRNASSGKTDYTGGIGPAVLTLRNANSKAIVGIHVDARTIADQCIDVGYVGTASGVVGDAAPANDCAYRDWYCENARMRGVNVNQAADCDINNITYRGGTAPIAMSMNLEGGGIWARHLHFYTGALEISAQNAQVSDSVLLKGTRIVSASFNDIKLNSCQLSTDPLTGYTITCPVTPGSFGPGSVLIDNTLFLGGSTHTYYFGGRWKNGALLTGCSFIKPVNTFFDPAMIPVGGATRPPTFDFQFCSFYAGNDDDGNPVTPTIPAFPVSIPGVVRVARFMCTRSDGIVVATRVFPADIQVGDTGLITADTFQVTGTGMFVRGQTGGVIPSDTSIGLTFNRGGNAKAELIHDGAVFGIATKSGTQEFTFNGGSGFYPAVTNTLSLGIAGQVWTEVRATNGTIVTSDARLKTPVRELHDIELDAARDIAAGLGAWQWLEDGPDGQLHIGTTVQEIMSILAAHGLDWRRYSFVIRDEEADHFGLQADQLNFFLNRAADARLRKLEALVG